MFSLEQAFVHLDRYVQARMATGRTPAVALALTNRQETMYVATYGQSDLATGAPVTETTLFSIGSVGKAFAAVAALQAQESGAVDLRTPLAEILPWFRVRSAYAPITLHHLLTHTAGLIRGVELAPDPHSIAWSLRQTQTGFAPGTRCHYSDVGYKLLGLALEKVQGRPYRELLRRGILEPLDMADSEPALTHALRPRLARGYHPLYDDRPAHSSHPLVPAPWVETDSADGSVVASVGDMARFVRMLLNGGQGPAGAILSPAGFRLMTTPWIAGDDSIWGSYGYGLFVFENDGSTFVGHGGDTPGYEAYIAADLDQGYGVALLATQPYPAGLIWGTLNILRAGLLGRALPPLPPAPDPTRIDNAADYAGIYRAAGRTLALRASGPHLLLDVGPVVVVLEARGADTFYVNHPRFNLFPLHFGRDETGRVVEAWHGPDWYAGEGWTGPVSFDPPATWQGYAGHYRSFNPWESNFRVLVRQDRLLLAWPDGDEEVLVPLDDGTFRVGEDDWLPERISFGPIVDGQAWSAALCGSDYHCFFTP